MEEVNRKGGLPVIAADRGKTHRFHARTLFSSAGDLAMLDYAAKYGRESYLIADMPTRHWEIMHWVSLYRPDPDAHFTDASARYASA